MPNFYFPRFKLHYTRQKVCTNCNKKEAFIEMNVSVPYLSKLKVINCDKSYVFLEAEAGHELLKKIKSRNRSESLSEERHRRLIPALFFSFFRSLSPLYNI